MTDSLVDNIVEYRKATPFRSQRRSGQSIGHAIDRCQNLASRSMITAVGVVFRLTSRASVKETTRVIEAVVRVSGAQPQYLYWREY